MEEAGYANYEPVREPSWLDKALEFESTIAARLEGVAIAYRFDEEHGALDVQKKAWDAREVDFQAQWDVH